MTRPAVVGTHHIPGPDMRYTAGPGWLVGEAARELMNQPWVGVDIETYGLGTDARRIKCVAVAGQDRAVVFDPRDLPQKLALVDFLCEYRGDLVFHKSSFDVPNMHINGLIRVEDCARVLDTLVYARLAYPDKLQKKSLEAMSKMHLGMTTDETIEAAFKRLGMTRAEGYRTMDIDSPMYLMGVAVDACMTARLMPLIRKAAYDTLTKDHPFTRTGVSGQEAVDLVQRDQLINQRIALPRACRGLRVDAEYAERYRSKTADTLRVCGDQLTLLDIRPGNSGDLIKAMEMAQGFPEGHPRTPTGRPSCAAKDLEQLTHPIARLFVQHKRITHVLSDYLDKVVELTLDGRVHPTTEILVATTGRMSISDPPLHQFPGDARGIILPDEGDSLTSIDWSQVEPALIAYVSKDTRIIEQYESGTSDIYEIVAAQANVTRKHAKVILLAQLYGEGIGSLASDLDISFDAAKQLANNVLSTMPEVRKRLYLLRDIGARYRKICTIAGRIIPIPMGKGFDGRPPSVAVHKAVNYYVQGSAYDALAEALKRIIQAGLSDSIYLTMHDEVICSTPAAGDVERIMRTPPDRLCQLAGRVPKLRTDRLDLGTRWSVA